jgi:hypothetical protein
VIKAKGLSSEWDNKDNRVTGKIIYYPKQLAYFASTKKGLIILTPFKLFTAEIYEFS